jgi:hypothetical protein
MARLSSGLIESYRKFYVSTLYMGIFDLQTRAGAT